MSGHLHSKTKQIQELLLGHGINFTIVEFDELTRTAQEAATAIGCSLSQIAKTIVFRAASSDMAICVIASGSNRIDEKKIEQCLGEKIEKANANFVLEKTGYVIGGVSPIGLPDTVKILIDQDVMQFLEVWAAAGTPRSVFNIAPEALTRVTNGVTADIKQSKT